MKTTDFTFEQEELLANLYWPGKLARAKNSKARRNIRKSAAYKCLSDFYLTQGRTCRTCIHRSGKICDLQSDFYGQVAIKENQTCPAHRPNSAPSSNASNA